MYILCKYPDFYLLWFAISALQIYREYQINKNIRTAITQEENTFFSIKKLKIII